MIDTVESPVQEEKELPWTQPLPKTQARHLRKIRNFNYAVFCYRTIFFLIFNQPNPFLYVSFLMSSNIKVGLLHAWLRKRTRELGSFSGREMLIKSDICQIASFILCKSVGQQNTEQAQYHLLNFLKIRQICWAIQQPSIGCEHFWHGVWYTERQTKGKLERERFRPSPPPILPSFPSFSSSLHTPTHSFDSAHIGEMEHFFYKDFPFL